VIELDELLEMAYEERQAPTLQDDDGFWTNAREANDYVDEWPADAEE
jgi:hypothetical protein